MKITDLEIIPASKYLFIKIHTDSGIYGIGEVGAWGFLDGCEGVLKKYRNYLIGKDPFQIEHHWQYMYRSMFFRGNVLMSAISAIDIALWDIKGKAFNVPVYELLGGKCRDKVRTYAPVFKFTAEEMAKGCLELQQKGFTAARLMITADLFNPTNNVDDTVFNSKIEDYINRVRACREAVGPNFDFILEVHRSMSPSEAIAFAKGVEEFRPLILEDPISPDNIDALADVARRTNISIATGERAINVQEFQELINKKATKIVRPDVCVLGGITPSKKVCAIAEANYIEIAPHNPLGPVSTAACLQLDACIPNFLIQEFPSFYEQGNEAQMMKNPFEIENGFIIIPNKPGIGIDLVDDIKERFPQKYREINAQIGFDGSIKNV